MPEPIVKEKIIDEEHAVEILELSDDEFAKLPTPSEDPIVIEDSVAPNEDSGGKIFVGEEIPVEKSADEEVIKKPEDKEVIAEKPEKEVPLVEDVDDPKKEKLDESNADLVDPAKIEDKSVEVKEIVEKPAGGIDYKAEYEKLMAPFKANGQDMQIKNSTDAVRLWQMGLNYHKKMADLKPMLKINKLLEQNDLLDVEQINYLIDLKNKNPEAITKLLKDSSIDPLDINVKEDSNYVPTRRNVTDTEIDLDSVLDDIRDTPSYEKTLNVVTKVWDDSSRAVISQQPHIISIINGQMEDGTYDKVMGEVTYQRSLGNLRGINDFEAYKQMGDMLNTAGQLGPVKPAASVETEKPAAIIVSSKEPDTAEAKRLARKKAAKPARTPAGNVAPSVLSPMELSDEDFAKTDPSRFMIPKK